MKFPKKTFYIIWSAWLLFAGTILFYYAQGLEGISEGTGDYLGRDFINFWSAGYAAKIGAVPELYDISEYRSYLISLFGEPLNKYSFSYPPHSVFLFLPFGQLTYVCALTVWTVLGVAVFHAAIRHFKTQISSLFWLICPAVFVCIFGGQASLFLGAMLIGGLLMVPNRPYVAGILFGFLSIKPQFGPLLVLALFLSAEWRTILSAGLTTVALVAASIFLYGLEPWVIFINETLPYQSSIISSDYGIFDYMVPSPYKWVINLGASPRVALAFQSVFMILSILATYRVFRSSRPWLEKVATLCALTFLFSPYIALYDMVLLLPATMWLFIRSPYLAIFLLFVPITGFFAAMYNIPIYQISIVVLVICIVLSEELQSFLTRPKRESFSN